jgi:hypothetical protein
VNSLERVRNDVGGKPVDCLPAQPMIMMLAAKHIRVSFLDYTRDGKLLAAGQLKFAEDFDIDCLLTCSDSAREVVDIAGEDSIVWLPDQGPVINEEKAAFFCKPECLLECAPSRGFSNAALVIRDHERFVILGLNFLFGAWRSSFGGFPGDLKAVPRLKNGQRHRARLHLGDFIPLLPFLVNSRHIYF